MLEEEEEYPVFQVFKVSTSHSSNSNLVTFNVASGNFHSRFGNGKVESAAWIVHVSVIVSSVRKQTLPSNLRQNCMRRNGRG